MGNGGVFMKKKIAIIPSYCPGEVLVRLVEELTDNSLKCVVVNDGSVSKYDEIFNRLNKDATILRHETNKGKGAALKTAMKYIRDNFSDCVVVCVDGDGQHLTKDIIRCAELASLNSDSLVLGVRSFDRKDVPFKSYYGNKITETVFRLFTGTHITDTQTGLRAFDYSLLQDMLKVEGERYEYETNQLLYCVDKKIPIQQLQIETVYEGNNECSHFNALRDSFLIYKQLFKFVLSSFSSFIVDYVAFVLISNLIKGKSYLIISNVLARLISGGFNYETNRKVVFKDKTDRSKSLVKYIMLALVILLFNSLILNVLVNSLGLAKEVSKIITEMIMFMVSWFIQKRYVFAIGSD